MLPPMGPQDIERSEGGSSSPVVWIHLSRSAPSKRGHVLCNDTWKACEFIGDAGVERRRRRSGERKVAALVQLFRSEVHQIPSASSATAPRGGECARRRPDFDASYGGGTLATVVSK